MPPVPIHLDGLGVDLSGRLYGSTTVVGSPAAATETIIASLTLSPNVAITKGVYLFGFAAWTVGTSGTGVNLKLRQTDTSGTTLTASGLRTSTATNLDALAIVGFDLSAAATGQVYVMTMTVANGAATSTVSAVSLFGLVV